ncbi:MAG: hypothetical protein ACYDGY_09780 [Acidimicrobiales bacterium]
MSDPTGARPDPSVRTRQDERQEWLLRHKRGSRLYTIRMGVD